MPLLLFENQIFAHSIKRRFQRKRSCKEEKWMSEASIKSRGTEPSQVPFRHFATKHENVQKRKGEILTEPEAAKRLKSEMITRKGKRLQEGQTYTWSEGKETPIRKNAGNAEQIVKKCKGLKQPKAKPYLKDQKKLVKKASESISHKVVSKDSEQGSSHMSMDSGKNLPCWKSERQLV